MQVLHRRGIIYWENDRKFQILSAWKKIILPVCDVIFLIFNLVVVDVFNMGKYKSVLFS